MKSKLSVLGALMVAACGGGGGGQGSGSGSAPVTGSPATPPPATTMPPPAASTPAPATSPSLLTGIGQDVPGFSGSGTIAIDGSGYAQSIGFIYSSQGNPDTRATVTSPGSFRYHLVAGFYGENEGTIALTQQPTSTAVWRDLAAQVNGTSYRIRQLVVGPGNPEIPLSYATMAIARAVGTRSGATGATLNVVPLSFGFRYVPGATAIPDMLTFEGRVAGYASARQLEGTASSLSTRNIYDVTGSLRIEHNMRTGESRGTMRLSGRNDVTGETVDLGTREISSAGAVPSATELRATAGDGSIFAVLAGPNGEELMGAFDGRVPDPATPSAILQLSGVLVARR